MLVLKFVVKEHNHTTIMYSILVCIRDTITSQHFLIVETWTSTDDKHEAGENQSPHFSPALLTILDTVGVMAGQDSSPEDSVTGHSCQCLVAVTCISGKALMLYTTGVSGLRRDTKISQQ